MKVEMQQRIQGKRRKLKKFYRIALPILLLSLLVGSGIAFAVYSAKYSNYASLAQTGVQHLRTAATLLETLPKNLLDVLTVSRAQCEFAAAMTTFVQLDDGLRSLQRLEGARCS